MISITHYREERKLLRRAKRLLAAAISEMKPSPRLPIILTVFVRIVRLLQSFRLLPHYVCKLLLRSMCISIVLQFAINGTFNAMSIYRYLKTFMVGMR